MINLKKFFALFLFVLFLTPEVVLAADNGFDSLIGLFESLNKLLLGESGKKSSFAEILIIGLSGFAIFQIFYNLGRQLNFNKKLSLSISLLITTLLVGGLVFHNPGSSFVGTYGGVVLFYSILLAFILGLKVVWTYLRKNIWGENKVLSGLYILGYILIAITLIGRVQLTIVSNLNSDLKPGYVVVSLLGNIYTISLILFFFLLVGYFLGRGSRHFGNSSVNNSSKSDRPRSRENNDFIVVDASLENIKKESGEVYSFLTIIQKIDVSNYSDRFEKVKRNIEIILKEIEIILKANSQLRANNGKFKNFVLEFLGSSGENIAKNSGAICLSIDNFKKKIEELESLFGEYKKNFEGESEERQRYKNILVVNIEELIGEWGKLKGWFKWLEKVETKILEIEKCKIELEEIFEKTIACKKPSKIDDTFWNEYKERKKVEFQNLSKIDDKEKAKKLAKYWGEVHKMFLTEFLEKITDNTGINYHKNKLINFGVGKIDVEMKGANVEQAILKFFNSSKFRGNDFLSIDSAVDFFNGKRNFS